MGSVVMNCGGIAAGPVKGMPFSAQEITEKRLITAGGAILTEVITSLIARDAEGRSWRQMLTAAVPGKPQLPSISMISDPIAGYRYLMYPNLMALRSRLPGGGQLPTMPGAPSPAIPGMPAGAMPSMSAPQELGERMIEGFLAKGIRYTSMVPPSITGATQPVQMVTESWCAKELGAVLHTSFSNPQIGEITTKLSGIQQAHPPGDLFQVPGHYQVVDTASKISAMPNIPSAPQVPTVPHLPSPPNLPSAPAVPARPNLPSAPSINLPSAPNIPSAPALPNLPSAPSINVPSAPSAPNIPSAPALPNLPVAPAVPNVPVKPSAPTLPSVPKIPGL